MLKLTLKNSQRDSRWANTLLGYNTNSEYTIGKYGCLVSCLGNYTGKTPAEVNQILKDNSGFQSGGGLFIWSKCTILGLNQTYVSSEYTGPVTTAGLTKIKDSVNNGYPVLCEIDFNPSTSKEEQHFVLVIGIDGEKFFIHDPWTGDTVNLDIYGGAARAIIKFRTYDKKLEVETESAQPDWLIKNSDNWIGTLAYLEISKPSPTLDDVKDVVGGIRARANDMEKQKGEAEAKIISLTETLGTKDSELLKAQNDEKACNSKLSETEKLLTEAQGQVKGMIDEKQKLNETIAELQSHRPYDELWRVKKYFIGKYK
jgi:hypothetical protein